jgi:3-hydroxyacyl-CoA dehydrogenase
MKIVIVGAGLMGAQIGADYVAAGHEVTLVTRSQETATESVARALDAVATRASALTRALTSQSRAAAPTSSSSRYPRTLKSRCKPCASP